MYVAACERARAAMRFPYPFPSTLFLSFALLVLASLSLSLPHTHPHWRAICINLTTYMYGSFRLYTVAPSCVVARELSSFPPFSRSLFVRLPFPFLPPAIPPPLPSPHPFLLLPLRLCARHQHAIEILRDRDVFSLTRRRDAAHDGDKARERERERQGIFQAGMEKENVQQHDDADKQVSFRFTRAVAS